MRQDAGGSKTRLDSSADHMRIEHLSTLIRWHFCEDTHIWECMCANRHTCAEHTHAWQCGACLLQVHSALGQAPRKKQDLIPYPPRGSKPGGRGERCSLQKSVHKDEQSCVQVLSVSLGSAFSEHVLSEWEVWEESTDASKPMPLARRTSCSLKIWDL